MSIIAPGKRKENGDEPEYTLGDVMEYFGKDRDEPVSSVIIKYRIDYLSRNMFQSQALNISSMFLDNNKIGKLPVGVFSELIHLENLSLENNLLEEVPNGVFSGLNNLTALWLNRNHMKTLPNGIFSGLSNLHVLSVSNNSLEELPKGAFSGLVALRDLNLSGNRLEGLSDGIFSELHKLENLQLSHNLLKNLPDDVFANLTELFVLYLKNNQLEELPLSIENLSNLVQLDVTRNPLIDPIQPLLLTDFSGNRIRAYLQKAVKEIKKRRLELTLAMLSWVYDNEPNEEEEETDQNAGKRQKILGKAIQTLSTLAGKEARRERNIPGRMPLLSLEELLEELDLD